MFADSVQTALKTPGHLRFPGNQSFIENFEQAGGRAVCQASGHLVFYRPDGLRFLCTDPAGNVLHECEWTEQDQGSVALSRVRIKLDWGGWVGIKPGGLVNETKLNLATKPGWQRLTADDLRAMAAQALQVPLEEIRWFYRDEDLSIGPSGVASIRHRKDALYVLEDGSFDRARFMSCMGAMHWSRIDFLPVVELFKSLLPGTGSAAFELIRGLYDDQNRDRSSPPPLRYRGIPTYPSEAAFRLFSSFFTPQVATHRDPLALFMDQTRAHEVLWLPSSSPPLRFFDSTHHCCLTFQGGALQKVTLSEDSTGLPFVSVRGRKISMYDRSAHIVGNHVLLKDREHQTVLPVSLPEVPLQRQEKPVDISPVDWRSVFVRGIPPISAHEAFRAVLLYPEGDGEISELAAQPFVADYLQDLAEQDREIGATMADANRVLIENADAVIATCVSFDRPRDYTVLVQVPAFAQRQAQQLWAICADLGRWDWLARVRFLPQTNVQAEPDSGVPHDLAYVWMPYAMANDPALHPPFVHRIGTALRPGGRAFIVGPPTLATHWPAHNLGLSWQEAVEELPTFRMHRNILPKARLKSGLTLYHVHKA